MDKKMLVDVCKQIYHQFPNFDQISPVIKSQPNQSYLLIFTSSGSTHNGHTIPLVLRVVVNQEGKIVKTTTSR